jgi:hypothetical protein
VRTSSLPPSALPADASAAPETPHLYGVKLTAILVFFVVCAWFSFRVVQGALALGVLWWLPVTAIAGYVAADLVSGLVHFLADNFAEADTPIIGAAFVRPFREHHTDPLGITRHGFVETNGNNVIVSLPVILPAALLLPVTTSTIAWLVGSFTLIFIFAVFLTNQIHKWAHQPEPPAFALRLQRAGLILSKEHHDVHHTSPFDTHYCITVGVWNRLLERVRLWERLEDGMRRWLPGTDPRRRVEREAEARARQAAAAAGRVDG